MSIESSRLNEDTSAAKTEKTTGSYVYKDEFSFFTATRVRKQPKQHSKFAFKFKNRSSGKPCVVKEDNGDVVVSDGEEGQIDDCVDDGGEDDITTSENVFNIEADGSITSLGGCSFKGQVCSHIFV